VDLHVDIKFISPPTPLLEIMLFVPDHIKLLVILTKVNVPVLINETPELIMAKLAMVAENLKSRVPPCMVMVEVVDQLIWKVVVPPNCWNVSGKKFPKILVAAPLKTIDAAAVTVLPAFKF